MGTVSGLLKSGIAPLPGIDKDKTDYYRLFLDTAFGVKSSKNLSKAEAATLINWMMWADGESFSVYREDKPFISDVAKEELRATVKKLLAKNDDVRGIDI